MTKYDQKQSIEWFPLSTCHGPDWILPPFPKLERKTKERPKGGRRGKRMLTAFGRTQSLRAWAMQLQITPETIRSRIDLYHWSVEKALSKEPRRKL